MDVLYVLGAIGGILILFERMIGWCSVFCKWYKKYRKMQHYYERNHPQEKEKMPMGFMTEQEKSDIQARMSGSKRA